MTLSMSILDWKRFVLFFRVLLFFWCQVFAVLYVVMSDLIPPYPQVCPVRAKSMIQPCTSTAAIRKGVLSLASIGVREPNQVMTVVTSDHGQGKPMAQFFLGYAKSHINDGELVWVKTLDPKLMSARFQSHFSTSCDLFRQLCQGTSRFAGNRTHSQPKSPSFATLHDIVLIDRMVYLVMEFYESRSVKDLLLTQNASKPEVKLVAIWTRSLLDALKYLQEVGVAHYGVHPGHVMLSSGSVKLSGWTRSVASFDGNGSLLLVKRLRRSSRFQHLPIECFVYEAHDPTRIDTWSIASFVVNCVTLQHPFSPTTGVKYKSQWSSFKALYLKELGPLKKFLDKCFTINAVKRASVDTLITDQWLASTLENKASSAGSVSKKSSSSSSPSELNSPVTKKKSIKRSNKKSVTTEEMVADPGISSANGTEGGQLGQVPRADQMDYESLRSHNMSQEEGAPMADRVAFCLVDGKYVRSS